MSSINVTTPDYAGHSYANFSPESQNTLLDIVFPGTGSYGFQNGGNYNWPGTAELIVHIKDFSIKNNILTYSLLVNWHYQDYNSSQYRDYTNDASIANFTFTADILKS
jgi:hypothetical protein